MHLAVQMRPGLDGAQTYFLLNLVFTVSRTSLHDFKYNYKIYSLSLHIFKLILYVRVLIKTNNIGHGKGTSHLFICFESILRAMFVMMTLKKN
jgi:hypothetical protein